ncbi:M1 family peptidase [Stakelama sp. CBK3Z-3]|uniref:M1 family peptidase n=1 Tax=Stakelama flava TaxID=2860338 RepID=A0ABS6XKS0_9SPHN|nr:M1 family aminopeptidase [Stakelama flava]MBW4330807.1 M1 family peptidase [Stakelama flava]
MIQPTAFPALLMIAPLSAAAHPAPTPSEAGFDVDAYRVAMTPDLSNGAVMGEEAIRLTPLRDGLGALRFSPNALTISEATIDGRAVRVTSDDDGIVFTPARAPAKGKALVLRLRFSGTPKRGVEVVPGGLYSSYFACDWMVCQQDMPGDKAKLKLALTVPDDANVSAPGQRIATRKAGAGRKVETWRTTRAWSPYTYAFAIGDFPHVADGALAYVNASGAAADLSAMFVETPAMVAFLSDKAGVALPVDRFTQILVPGYEAQEAAGMSLIGRKALERDLAKPDEEWIVIHELSHQWWGNLVTCDSWRDFWLNEGFAIFMTAAWKEHRYGRAAYNAELDVARARLAKAREAGFDKPLAWDGKYPSIGLRRAVQYGKGALFLDHLRRLLGEQAFWAGVRRYTRAHAGGTVVSADLQRAMEAASGRDLSDEFTRWVGPADQPREAG